MCDKDKMLAAKTVSVPQSVYSTSPVRRHHHRHNVKSRYEFLKTLGKGTYGKVNLARHKETDKLVAVKVIKKDKIRDNVDMKHIRREMELMSSIKHPHIIQIYEVFENQDKIVIVMEYASGGELYDYLSSKREITNDEAKSFFSQIVCAIQYCHNIGIVHRDIKLENILLDADYQIKIADFGLANYFTPDGLLQTFCGSPLYASPEIVCGMPYKGPEVDSWSLGVLLYALVYGTMPFDGRNYQTLSWQITSGVFSKPPKTSSAHDLICWMLTVDPKKRATINDIADHSWLRSISNSLLQSPTATQENLSYVKYLASKIDINDHPIDQLDAALKEEGTQTSPSSRPKGILKHKQETASEWRTSRQQADKIAEENLAGQLAAVCGLSAKDSLKLKVKPQSSCKRRVVRSRRERESGYYSSPERVSFVAEESSSSEPVLHTVTSADMPQIKSSLVRPRRLSRLSAKQYSSLPSRISHISNDCQLKPMPPVVKERLASVSSDDGYSVGSQTRPDSTYSDSSVLSSDSFDLCSFNVALVPPSGSSLPSSTQASCIVTTEETQPVPVVPDTLPPLESITLEEQSSGTLTPKSEKLVRDLQRILAPSGRRSRTRTQRLSGVDSSKKTQSCEAKTELSSMMKQLNRDLVLAYEKACFDICANLNSAEV